MLKKLLKTSISACLFLSVALSSVIAFGEASYEYDGFYDYSIACKDKNWRKNKSGICNGQKFPMRSTFRFDGKKIVGEYTAKETDGETIY